jgi:uncharacterized damage-inducible protein DinB
MNAVDILKYGHQTVLGTVDGLPEGEWETGAVCGVWSVKDIMAHLASYEHLLVEVLNMFLGDEPTPYLALRKDNSVAQVLAEYEEVQARTMTLAVQVPEETRRQPGTLPWYGTGYALDDFIVYQYYGHKREHSAQINVFRDGLA